VGMPIVTFVFIKARPWFARLVGVSLAVCSLGLVGGALPGSAEAAFVKQGPPLPCGPVGGLSADGNTALAGWCVFVRKGSTWSLQAELKPTDPVEFPPGGEGEALSGDGNTVILNEGEYLWVFTRSGSTWTQQGPRLTASPPAGEEEGCGGVGLSNDGNTAVLGGCRFGAYFFARSGTTWAQQALGTSGQNEDLTNRNGLALSADGKTAIVTGGTYANLIVRSGSSWHVQQVLSIYLTCRECAGVSSDGSTVLAGGGTVLVRSGSTWSVQKYLKPKGRIPEERVWGEALSGDGSTALVNSSTLHAQGVGVIVFHRYGSTWVEQETLTGYLSDERVALSADATTALVGEGHGAQPYVETGGPPPPPPMISSLSPRKGRAAGGTSVTITGTSFTGATAVKFGSTNAPSFTVNSATSITAKSPAGTKGTVDITVTSPNGTSPLSKSDRFTYFR
jgi:IPT/TIG domain-containing protein